MPSLSVDSSNNNYKSSDSSSSRAPAGGLPCWHWKWSRWMWCSSYSVTRSNDRNISPKTLWIDKIDDLLNVPISWELNVRVKRCSLPMFQQYRQLTVHLATDFEIMWFLLQFLLWYSHICKCLWEAKDQRQGSPTASSRLSSCNSQGTKARTPEPHSSLPREGKNPNDLSCHRCLLQICPAESWRQELQPGLKPRHSDTKLQCSNQHPR